MHGEPLARNFNELRQSTNVFDGPAAERRLNELHTLHGPVLLTHPTDPMSGLVNRRPAFDHHNSRIHFAGRILDAPTPLARCERWANRPWTMFKGVPGRP